MALKADFDRIRDYFESEFDRDGAQGLAIFSAGLDNVWRPRPLIQSVPDKVHVGREFHLAPLVPLVGRGEGAIVAVVGRERGDLLRLASGRLGEIADRTVEIPGRHDQGGWSQSRFQRHIEKLVGEHLREVAEELDRRVRAMRSPKVDRRLLGRDARRVRGVAVEGDPGRRSSAGRMPRRTHRLPTCSSWRAPSSRRRAPRRRARSIERWREEAGRGGRASSGWSETLEAASDERIEVLLYAESADQEAWQCPACGRLSAAGGQCPLDGTEMEQRDDGLDLAVHQTVAHGGTVWAVTAHHDLDPVEGIGALLRY